MVWTYVITAVLSAAITFIFCSYMAGSTYRKHFYGKIQIDESDPEKDLFQFVITEDLVKMMDEKWVVFSVHREKEKK